MCDGSRRILLFSVVNEPSGLESLAIQLLVVLNDNSYCTFFLVSGILALVCMGFGAK